MIQKLTEFLVTNCRKIQTDFWIKNEIWMNKKVKWQIKKIIRNVIWSWKWNFYCKIKSLVD